MNSRAAKGECSGPLVGRGLAAATVLQRWRRLPPVDAQLLRADLHQFLDASL